MPRVLIVEDSPTQAQRFALILEDAGFATEIAPDAERAWLSLQAEPFDLVLSDLHLPGDSGFDLCQRLKAGPLRRIPIVVCTGEADPLNVLRGLQCGADSFFTKDRAPEKIVSNLRRVLARSAAGGCEGDGDGPPVRVPFLDQTFELRAGREQMIDIMVSAFEDVVQLNDQYRAAAFALRERNQQLQQLADSERQALENLKQAEGQLVQAEKLSALGRMVAGVAHEINNPLAFVTNNVAVLRRDVELLQDLIRRYQEADDTLAAHDPALSGRIRDYAESIDLPYTQDSLRSLLGRSAEGLKRIQQIVKNLRDFARLDEAELKEADLNEGIASTIALIRSQADQRRVAIASELAGDLPRITCYPAQINQVVLNLVANAIEACPEDGDGRVTVATRRADAGVEIVVDDNGPGIDPAIRGQIFDPFFTTKAPGQGTGLGLSVSYGIVEAHGGRIDVDSTVGRGTRFVVRLPLAPASQAGRPPRQVPRPAR